MKSVWQAGTGATQNISCFLIKADRKHNAPHVTSVGIREYEQSETSKRKKAFFVSGRSALYSCRVADRIDCCRGWQNAALKEQTYTRMDEAYLERV